MVHIPQAVQATIEDPQINQIWLRNAYLNIPDRST